MKSLAVLFFCVTSFCAYSQDSGEQAMLQIEDQFLLAIVNKDTSHIHKIYDDRFQGVLASGQSVDKTKQIEFHLSGSPHITLGIENVKAVVLGNVAVTTGKQVNKARSGHVIGQSKFIRVYQKNGDRWSIIRSQGTIVVQD